MYKVFVVEDDEIIREELCCLLAGNGLLFIFIIAFCKFVFILALKN